jgi:hypothetical protein
LILKTLDEKNEKEKEDRRIEMEKLAKEELLKNPSIDKMHKLRNLQAEDYESESSVERSNRCRKQAN